MDVEKLSKKKSRIAQPATENTPTEPEIIQPAIPEPKPLTINERMALIEQQLSMADKNFQQIGVFIEKMAPLIDLSNKISQQQQAPASQMPKGGLDVQGLLNSPMLKEILGSGGGQNSVLEEYGRQYMDLSGFVVKEVFKNIVPEAVTRMEAAAAARIAAKVPA
jgi:hypothetical protein